MKNIFRIQDLKQEAHTALICALDYIRENQLESVWTKRRCGWQELCANSKFSGLYATCNAIMLLLFNVDRYRDVICSASEELAYVYDTSKSYDAAPDDSEEEETRKKRCALLLKENCNITLKAVFFLRTYLALAMHNIQISPESKFQNIVDSALEQIEAAYDSQSGLFMPAKENHFDKSMMTTMYAFILMNDFRGTTAPETVNGIKLFLDMLDNYKKKYTSVRSYNISKFERYIDKRNAIIALYALAHSIQCLNKRDQELLREAWFITISDHEIRDGFLIKDSFLVPSTLFSRDQFQADSKVLYLEATVKLIEVNVLPFEVLECVIDDLVEIIDTVKEKKQYVAWDMAPSFSHNANGLMVLESLVRCLDCRPKFFSAIKIQPLALGRNNHYAIAPKSVVLFMPFRAPHTESFRSSVQEVLSEIGFSVWCASDDPYDALVMDHIWNRLCSAQFVIIDCTGRGANVMYETGVAHGLGKRVLLCGPNNNAFPYESSQDFDICIYDPDGDMNPPPFRDLQKGICKFIKKYMEEFCIAAPMSETMLKKLESFKKKNCTE